MAKSNKRFRLPKRLGEQWIEIYPGYYLSSEGRWYSRHFCRLIKQFPNSSGYYRVTVKIDGNRKQVFTHIKVVEHFGDSKDKKPPEGSKSLFEYGLSIDHLDGNKKNNAKANLELISHKLNCRRRELRYRYSNLV